jgi:hypothetical protein
MGRINVPRVRRMLIFLSVGTGTCSSTEPFAGVVKVIHRRCDPVVFGGPQLHVLGFTFGAIEVVESHDRLDRSQDDAVERPEPPHDPAGE